MELEGKVALVTGGTKGIGAATAVRFAELGADVAILGRHDDDDAKSVKAAIEQKRRRCLMIVADMARPEDAVRAVDETIGKLRTIDVLFHREGTAGDVADAIAFLVRNDYITGQVVVIDGGLTMRIG